MKSKIKVKNQKDNKVTKGIISLIFMSLLVLTSCDKGTAVVNIESSSLCKEMSEKDKKFFKTIFLLATLDPKCKEYKKNKELINAIKHTRLFKSIRQLYLDATSKHKEES